MAIAAKLTAILNLNSASFEKNLKKSKNNFNQFSDSLKKGAKLSAAAIGATTAALGALAIRQAGVIDETAKLSKALGVNVREFQALALVADESAITQDNLGNIITRSQRSIIEASRGLETYARSFKTLNIDAKELLKSSPDEQFIKIAKALSQIENPTLRTATALEIFGRSGRQVINALDGLINDLDSAREFNDKFNISLSEIDAAKVEEANDTFGRLGKVLGGLGNTIAVRFAPLVTEISNMLLSAGVDGVSFTRTLDSALKAVSSTIDAVRKGILGISGAFLSLQKSIAERSVRNRELFGFDATKQKKELEIITQAYSDLTKEIRSFESVSDKLKKIEDEAGKRAASRVGKGEELKKQMAALASAEVDASLAIDKVSESTKDAAKNMDDLRDASDQAFSSLVSDVVSGKNALSSFADFGRNVIGSIFNSIQSKISGGIGGSIGGLISSGVGNLLSGSLPSFSFATGIQNVPYDMTARLHKGEMVVPAQQASKMQDGGASGGYVVNIDARGAQAGVEDKIRAVMQEVMTLRKDVPSIAVNSVSTANKRNPRLLSV